MPCRVGFVTKLFLLICFFELLFYTFPNGIRIHLTADAIIADSEIIEGRVIRAIVLHVTSDLKYVFSRAEHIFFIRQYIKSFEYSFSTHLHAKLKNNQMAVSNTLEHQLNSWNTSPKLLSSGDS